MAGIGGSRDGCRVYLITPPKLDPLPFTAHLAAALDAGDVAAVQLRLKDVDDDAWRRAIDALRPVTQSRNVAFLLNDRADLVRETGSDGAHVGQEDMPAREARRVMGPDAILGVTCKGSRDLAMQAGEDGADYVAFGAFFPSGTKDVNSLHRPRDSAMVVGADGVAVLRDRRDHRRELCTTGAGRRRFPRCGWLHLEASRRPRRRCARAERGDCGSTVPLGFHSCGTRPAVTMIARFCPGPPICL